MDADELDVMEARRAVMRLYDSAQSEGNGVLVDELAEIEHRLCLVTQIIRNGEEAVDRG